MTRRAVGALVVLGLGLGRAAAAAPPTSSSPASPTVQRVLGEVTSVEVATRRISLQTDTGDQVVVTTDDKTSFLRAEPGARDLSGAAPATLAEISVGDRVLARGPTAGDGRTLAARQVVVMGRPDLVRKQERERAEWRARGLSGVVTALDPARQEFTLETRSLAGSQSVRVVTGDGKAAFRRYAPGSIRFGDAVSSSFSELQVGDQVRALGERTPDGSRLVAEQVVSGAFQIVSGAVKSASRREVTITDNETGKRLVVEVGAEAMARRLPSELAARLARRSRPGMTRADGGGEAPGTRKSRDAPTLQDMLERLPAMPIEELKPGDQIAVSSPKGHTPGRLIAAVVVAGIEPLLESRSRRAAEGGEAVGLAPGALDFGLGVP